MFAADHALEDQQADCPYCGEPLTLLIDPGDAGGRYIEDCQVCCCPMVVSIEATDYGLRLALYRDDEVPATP